MVLVMTRRLDGRLLYRRFLREPEFESLWRRIINFFFFFFWFFGGRSGRFSSWNWRLGTGAVKREGFVDLIVNGSIHSLSIHLSFDHLRIYSLFLVASLDREEV